jgi:hypothetical protein
MKYVTIFAYIYAKHIENKRTNNIVTADMLRRKVRFEITSDFSIRKL